MTREGKEYGRRRFLYAGWAVVETMLFGGIVNGWASLVFVLKEDGLYRSLCTSTPSDPIDNVTASSAIPEVVQGAGCSEQDAMLNLWFTIAAALRNIFGIVVGLHVFRFGTRSARLTGWVSFIVGSLMMAFANDSIAWLLLPSLMALSYGGVTLLLTNVQVSCLFPRYAGVVITLVSGAFDFSASTQLVVKLLHESGLLTRLHSYLGLCGLHAVMVLVSTLCFMPKDMFVTRPDPPPSLDSPRRPAASRKRRDSLYDWSEIHVHHRHRHSTISCVSWQHSSSNSSSSSRDSVSQERTGTTDTEVYHGDDRKGEWKEGFHGVRIMHPAVLDEEPLTKSFDRAAQTDDVFFIGRTKSVTKQDAPTDGEDDHECDEALTEKTNWKTSAETQPAAHFAEAKSKWRNEQHASTVIVPAEEPKVKTIANLSTSTDYSRTVRAPNYRRANGGVRAPFSSTTKSLSLQTLAEPKATSNLSIATISGTIPEKYSRTMNKERKFVSIIQVTPMGFTTLSHGADLSNSNATANVSDNKRNDVAETCSLEAKMRHVDNAERDGWKPRPNGSLKVKANDDPLDRKVKATGHSHVTLAVEDMEDTEKQGEGAEKPVSVPVSVSAGEAEDLFPTLKSCVTSPVFWLHVMWQAFNVLRLVAFFGLLNRKLSNMFKGDREKVSFFTNVQAYCMLAIMAVCWISGAVYDWQTSALKGRHSRFQRLVLPGALPLAMTSLVGVAITVLWLIDSEKMLYVMFTLLVFYNAFIFGVCISFLLRVFPPRYFGILNGVLSFVVGAFCFTQYGVFRWHDAYPQGPLHADIFMLTLVILSLLHPLYIVIKGACCDVKPSE